MGEFHDRLGSDARAHLACCPVCRQEYDRFWAGVTALACKAQQQAEQPEAFWHRQREQIAGGRGKRRNGSMAWPWVWAPAVIAGGLLLVLWSQGDSPPAPSAVTDHELLASVQRSIATEVPSALQPAALLVAEIEDGGPRADHAHTVRQGGH